MAEQTITIRTCDICPASTADGVEIVHEEVPVVWTTEQTEGRSISPRVRVEKLDICTACMDRIANERQMPDAAGAQGYNRFYFRDPAPSLAKPVLNAVIERRKLWQEHEADPTIPRANCTAAGEVEDAAVDAYVEAITAA